MPNCFSDSIKELQESACPSIQYRVREEILGDSAPGEEMDVLQTSILQDRQVVKILSLAREDGWLGDAFHGEADPETGIRFLREKGVRGDHPVIAGALRALEERGDAFDDGALVRVGKWLDEAHLGGSLMIKAWVFACAGQENREFVRLQEREAIEGFRFILSLSSIEELYTPRGNKYVFRPGTAWPSIYHLRLLAYTSGWRTPENKEMLFCALEKLVQWSPIPPVKLLRGSQLVSPASLFMNDFAKDIDALSPKEWMMWFHRMELIARLDLSQPVPKIWEQAEALKMRLTEWGGRFALPLSHFYFTKWTQYIGLALESNWKDENARMRDLTFRSLLILSKMGFMD